MWKQGQDQCLRCVKLAKETGDVGRRHAGQKIEGTANKNKRIISPPREFPQRSCVSRTPSLVSSVLLFFLFFFHGKRRGGEVRVALCLQVRVSTTLFVACFRWTNVRSSFVWVHLFECLSVEAGVTCRCRKSKFDLATLACDEKTKYARRTSQKPRRIRAGPWGNKNQRAWS